MDSISNVFENCFSLLKSNGKVVITQAFLTSEQIYGANICDGFDGLIDYLNSEDINNMFQIEYKNYDDSNSYVHNDGLIVLRRV